MTNQKTYKYLILSLTKKDLCLLEEINEIALSEFGCGGVEEFSLEEKQVDEILGDRAYSGGDIPIDLLDEVDSAVKSKNNSSYKYFFYEGNISENINKFVSFLKENSKDFDYTFEVLEDNWEDWNTSWRKHYKIVEISKNMQIIPEWFKDKHIKSDYKNIYINPGMGFGTGEHETTHLCLQLYDKLRGEFKTSDLCLDFGCGSGILGIAAIKFNQMKVEFCDIDSNALDNCVQNLELNFNNQDLSAHRLVIRERFSTQKGKYELVFANILENILLLEKELIIDSMKSNGKLIISGLLNSQVENIIEKYSNELLVSEVISLGDWSAILLTKK